MHLTTTAISKHLVSLVACALEYDSVVTCCEHPVFEFIAKAKHQSNSTWHANRSTACCKTALRFALRRTPVRSPACSRAAWLVADALGPDFAGRRVKPAPSATSAGRRTTSTAAACRRPCSRASVVGHRRRSTSYDELTATRPRAAMSDAGGCRSSKKQRNPSANYV